MLGKQPSCLLDHRQIHHAALEGEGRFSLGLGFFKG
jgi:hypothetical protein